MTTSTLPVWSQYYKITKPKVVLLIVFTAMVGMLLAADGAVPLDIFVFGLLGIGFSAASGAAINHIVDERFDVGAVCKLAHRIIDFFFIGRLCPDLYDVFEARYTAKYCPRWCGWRSATIIRLGRRYGSGRNRSSVTFPDNIYLDAAALLGTGDSSQGRVCKSRYSDVVGNPWCQIHQDPDIAIHYFAFYRGANAICISNEWINLPCGRDITRCGFFVLRD